jgi:hypothetical protein
LGDFPRARTPYRGCADRTHQLVANALEVSAQIHYVHRLWDRELTCPTGAAVIAIRLKSWPRVVHQFEFGHALACGASTFSLCDNGRMAAKPRKRPRDPVQLAKLIGDIATGQIEDIVGTPLDPRTVENKRKGGKLGGSARAVTLTPEQRSQIARAAAEARWKKSR